MPTVSFDTILRLLEDRGSCAVSGIFAQQVTYFSFRNSNGDRRENFNFHSDRGNEKIPGFGTSVAFVHYQPYKYPGYIVIESPLAI